MKKIAYFLKNKLGNCLGCLNIYQTNPMVALTKLAKEKGSPVIFVTGGTIVYDDRIRKELYEEVYLIGETGDRGISPFIGSLKSEK